MSELPILREPTRYERLVFRLTGRWPMSYVDARLTHDDCVSAALGRMSADERMRAILGEASYEAQVEVLDRDGLFDQIAASARRRESVEVNAYVDLLNELDRSST